jgi:GTP-binding protein HflX
MVADRLFSTLDPVTRRIKLADGTEFLLTDTVGFIHKLPPSIVAAFRATLEELREADVLLHIIDITHQDAAEQYETVERILQYLQIKDKYQINVLNKIDLMPNAYNIWQGIIKKLNYSEEVKIVPVSALKNTGLDILLAEIEVFLNKNRKELCYGTAGQN